MLRQLKTKQLHIGLIVFMCFLISTVSGCSQQDKETTSSNADVKQETDSTTPQTVIKPADDDEKTETKTKPMIDPANAIAVIETAKGNIEFAFYASDAPNASKSFIKNANHGYYRSEPFHVATELVLQAGSSFIDGKLPIEKSDNPLERGVLLFVKEDGATMTDGDEFLICRDNIELDGDQTIFGKVTKGLDVLDSIEENDKIVNITIRERNAE